MKITHLRPTIGPVGTTLTITGSGFGASQGDNTVTLNGMPVTPHQWTDTHIVVVTPRGTTSGPVVVQIAGVETGAGVFTVATDGRQLVVADPVTAIAALDVRVSALERLVGAPDQRPHRDPITGLDVVQMAPVGQATGAEDTPPSSSPASSRKK